MTTANSAAKPADLRFSQQLREATWALHQGLDPTAPENAPAKQTTKGLFDRLFDDSLSVAQYAHWHSQQYFIYDALESISQAWSDHAIVGQFVFNELLREKELASDLEFLLGDNWYELILPLPSTKQYVDRLNDVARHSSLAFVAHHYTRYLGDLSGGQAFKKAAQRNYQFEREGVSFYHFDDIASPKEFKEQYRRLLDQAGWSEGERQRIIDEVVHAYHLNGELLTELAQQMESEEGHEH